MLTDAEQLERRAAIVRILREGLVRKQADLVRLLKKEGHAATQSSISRDLRDLGVLKASGRYALPPDELTRAAQSVAVAIDKAQWPEVAGTLSGDDTIFIATANQRAQAELVSRLRALFRI